MIINTNTGPKKKLEEKESIKNLDKAKAIKLIIVCIVLIIIVIGYQFYKNYTSNYNYLKIDRGEYLVYTRYKQNNKEVPFININSNDIKILNENIVEYCNNYGDNDNLKINYEYSINGNYLSVVVKVINNEEVPSEIVFNTFNINLRTKSLMSDEELLQYFNVNQDVINAQINNQFIDMYKDEVAQGYLVESECNYECFLRYRGVEDYLSDLSYYIKDGKLVVYKPFVFSSIFGEEDYFTDDSFIFTITE